MQAPGMTESGQQGVHLLVTRACLRCEETSEHVCAGRMRPHTQQRRRAWSCQRNMGTGRALADRRLGASEEPQRDVHILPRATCGRAGFWQARVAPASPRSQPVLPAHAAVALPRCVLRVAVVQPSMSRAVPARPTTHGMEFFVLIACQRAGRLARWAAGEDSLVQHNEAGDDGRIDLEGVTGVSKML